MTERDCCEFIERTRRSTKIKECVVYFFSVLFLIGFVLGVVFVKYWAWAAAHPSAPLWTFFLGGR